MTVIQFPTKAGAVGSERRADPAMLTRRAILADAKALAPHDPVFLAIERYEAADDESNRIIGREPRAKSAAHRTSEAKYGSAVEAYNAAREAMLRTEPTTRIGAAALIGFVIDESNGDLDCEDAKMLLATLRDAIPSLA